MDAPSDRIITRFAPSPTGFLHIGGARTALFNWLYARHTGGKFLLRIEDTDRARSSQEAIKAIIEGLSWLGLTWDGEVVFQSLRAEQHVAAALRLLKEGKAYHCYASQEELAAMREAAKAAGKPQRYDGRWRDRDVSEAPPGVAPVVRLKAPQSGESVIHDQVQGTVKVGNEQLDDMVLLRSDLSPTYMLSVVVDDHDMGVTHVIRGDDHLTNAFRQKMLYEALGWQTPSFAHIPLIHGPDGAKLSKRHGALGIEAYQEMGFLPEALRNYLLRLSWAHGDHEIISDEEAIAWFDIKDVGRSPARFDMAKLTSLNAHYLKAAAPERLLTLLEAEGVVKSPIARARILRGLDGMKPRAKTLTELAGLAAIYNESTAPVLDESARTILQEADTKTLEALAQALSGLEPWEEGPLEELTRAEADKAGLKLGKLAQPLRAALTGQSTSPGIFEVMAILGKEESLARLRSTLAELASPGQ